jgi:hypothetical protein
MTTIDVSAEQLADVLAGKPLLLTEQPMRWMATSEIPGWALNDGCTEGRTPLVAGDVVSLRVPCPACSGLDGHVLYCGDGRVVGATATIESIEPTIETTDNPVGIDLSGNLEYGRFGAWRLVLADVETP